MTLDPLKLNLPEIAPVGEAAHRPFWSVMIPTYNRTEYLEVTLRSVLEQAPDPDQMQIEVVDDCSTEYDPEPLVKEIGKDRVSFYRQPQNVGQFNNLNTCIERSRGHWIHILHDDDCVRPGFYSRLRASLENNFEVGAAFSRFSLINEAGEQTYVWPLERETPGILENWLEKTAVEPRIQTPAIVVRRKVYEELGGFNPNIFWAADWEMWQRIATFYPFWYETEPLACYRTHNATLSSKMKRTAANIADIKQAIEFAQSYLPQTVAKEIETRAKEYWALFGIRTARQMLAVGDIVAATAQIQESLKCSNSPNVLSTLLVQQATKATYDFSPVAEWAQVPGTSSIEKIVLLQQVVKQLPAGANLVEIGCFQGRNTVALATVLPPGSVLHCIDNFQGLEPSKKNLVTQQNLLEAFLAKIERFGVKNQIKIWAINSNDASLKFAESSLEMIFLDRDRDYDAVKADLSHWYPKLKPGGLLFCDDYQPEWPGVMRAIKATGLDGRVVAGSLWVHRKPI